MQGKYTDEYIKEYDSVVWSWTSDSFKVQPKQLSDVIKADNQKLSLKDTFKTTYTGKDIIPTVDDINFANLDNTKDTNGNVIFTASDFVIGSTEGDTVNVTNKGVDVYLTTTKAGYAWVSGGCTDVRYLGASLEKPSF